MSQKPRPTVVFREEQPGIAARQSFDEKQFAHWRVYNRKYPLKSTLGTARRRYFVGRITWEEWRA